MKLLILSLIFFVCGSASAHESTSEVVCKIEAMGNSNNGEAIMQTFDRLQQNLNDSLKSIEGVHTVSAPAISMSYSTVAVCVTVKSSTKN